MTARLRVQKVFREIGLEGADRAERAPSALNEVWIFDDKVLRINPVQGSRRLLREVMLAERLPAGVGYPPVLDHGITRSGEWLLARRVPGTVLSRVWPGLREGERQAAVRELGERLRLIHGTVAPELADTAGEPYGVTAEAVIAMARDARALPHVDVGVLEAATAFVKACIPHLDGPDAWVLAHGDLHFENVLWHDGAVSAILDLEFSRPAPRDLDLATLVRFCAEPQLHVADDYEAVTRHRDYRHVPLWLGETYPELFAARHLRERLAVYDLAFDLWQLLRHPPTAPLAQLPPRHAFHRIRRTVEGRGPVASVEL